MRPFDLGQVYSTGEAIKAQRIQNQQAPMRNAMLQQQLDNARQSNQFAQNQENRAQTQFGQDQSLATLKDLYTGTTEIMNNFTAANRYIPRWKEMGLMPEGVEWDQMNPGEQMNLITATNRAAGEALKAQQQVSYKSASTPSSVQEWNYYQSLSPEQKKEFLNMKRSGNVKYLDTGAGYKPMSSNEPVQVSADIPKALPPEKDPNYIEKVEAIKDKVDRESKKEADKPKAIRRIQARYDQFKNLKREVTKAKSQANFWSTGFIGQKLQDIGGTDAKALKSTLTTIKANAGFDKLQEMRDNSPTGGALGQVAVQELEALQSVWTSLEQSQDKSQLISNLNAFEAQVDSSWKRVSEAFEQDYGIPWDGNETPEKPVEYDQELLQFMTDEERALFQ